MPSISTKPSAEASLMPTLSRFTALGNVIGSYYSDPSDFGQAPNQSAALDILANTDPVVVPVPDDLDGEYLLLQRYVLVLLYLYTNGDTWTEGRWLKTEAGDPTCKWSGVSCSDRGSIEGLERTYNTVKTEPVIYNIRSALTAVLFSKSYLQQPFRKPSH
jgi:hypothetical protein